MKTSRSCDLRRSHLIKLTPTYPRASTPLFANSMDETTTNENPAPQESGLNKIDLSQLQGFSFGTQWLQTKGAAHDEKRGSGERPRRDDRREAGAPDRRDRRSFRKPQGPVGE